MIALTYGTLPTPSALHAPARAAGVTADGTLSLCRRLIAARNLGGALLLLNALGFDWAAPEGCTCGQRICTCVDAALMDDDVASVAAALGGACERCRGLGYTAPRVYVCSACRALSAEVRP